MAATGTIASLHRFPVKSMLGETPARVELDADGIVGDRTWALRDAETGKLASAKRPGWWRALLDCTATGTGDDVAVTLPDGKRYAIDDPSLTGALGALLGRDVRLERAEHAQQGVYESEWPEIDGLTLVGDIDFPTNLLGEGTSFVDVGVLHLLTTASMRTLAELDPELVVDVARFRPSILIDVPDATGFVENDWVGRTLEVGDVTIEIGDPTPRCVMTTVAQGDLPRQGGVLRTLAEHNRQTNDFGTFACLGVYGRVIGGGSVTTGSPVTVS